MKHTTQQLTAAIIGCGNISRFHFAALAKAGVRVKWACDLNAEAAQKSAAGTGATITADWHDAISDDEVNFVTITTPSWLHKEIATAAIAAGKAVICEKTLATTPADAHAIALMASEAGVPLYTSYMKRYMPAMEKAKELLPTIGRITSSYFRTHQLWGDVWNSSPQNPFFQTPPGGKSQLVKSYGGGVLTCGGSHLIDLMLFFLGKPKRLTARVTTPDPQRDYDTSAIALLETATGPAIFEALAHPLKNIGYLHDGWDERIELTGTEGKIEVYSGQWDNPEHKPSRVILYNGDGITEFTLSNESPFDRAIDQFCTWIAAGEQGGQSPWTGYEVDEIIAHIELSSQSQGSLAINWQN